MCDHCQSAPVWVSLLTHLKKIFICVVHELYFSNPCKFPQIIPCKNDNILLHTENCWRKTDWALINSPEAIKQKCKLLLEMSHTICDCRHMLSMHTWNFVYWHIHSIFGCIFQLDWYAVTSIQISILKCYHMLSAI